MTLNQTDTNLLKTALDPQGGVSLFLWLKTDTTRISNDLYDDIRGDFMDWEDAYLADDLYITTGSGTHKLEGIDQFPVPTGR